MQQDPVPTQRLERLQQSVPYVSVNDLHGHSGCGFQDCDPHNASRAIQHLSSQNQDMRMIPLAEQAKANKDKIWKGQMWEVYPR